MRPRDVISYLRESATTAIGKSLGTVSPEMFTDVNKEYSQRLRREFVDEIQGAIPKINDIFDILSGMRKQIFRFNEFRREFEAEKSKGHFNDSLMFEEICRTLFHYSAIGNEPSQPGVRIFKYIYPDAKLNLKERGAIHLGLLQSLQIN